MRVPRSVAYYGIFVLALVLTTQSASAQGALDGAYKGSATSDSGGKCQSFRPTMTVEGGKLSIRYNQTVTLTGTVTAAGAVTGQGQAITGRGSVITINLSGQIAGGAAALKSESPTCSYDIKLTKE